MEFDDYIKYDLFDMEDINNITLYYGKVELTFCDNIEKSKSSYIFIDESDKVYFTKNKE